MADDRAMRAGRVPRMPRWLRQPRHGSRAWYCPFTLASGSDPRHESRVALLVVAALLLAGTPVCGDPPPILRLDDAIEEAQATNPEIKAARARAAAAAYMPRQASAYDDPVFSYEAWNAPESFDVTRADNNILKLSQKVPFPGKRSLAGTAAERGAGGARRAPQPGRSAIDRAAGRAGAEAARAGRRVAHRSGAAPAPGARGATGVDRAVRGEPPIRPPGIPARLRIHGGTFLQRR